MKVFLTRLARALALTVVVALLDAGPSHAQSTDAEAANALFVEAVVTARAAAAGDASAAIEARRLFDLLLLDYGETFPAQTVAVGELPPDIDLGQLPTIDQEPQVEGWNQSKKSQAEEYLSLHEADLARINRIADAADLALLAQAAYSDSYRDEALLAAEARGWVVRWRFERKAEGNPLVGVATALLFVNAQDEAVLAFRGTRTLGDWVTNIGGTPSALPLNNEQIDAARQIALEVSQRHGNLTYTGHSLGGRLAQVARIATGHAAVVFNTAPLGQNDKIVARFSASAPNSALSGFRSPEDPLTSLFSPDDVVVANITAVEGGGLTDLVNADYTHSMAVLARAMGDIRRARDGGWIDRTLYELRGGARSADAAAASSKTDADSPEANHPADGVWKTTGGWDVEIRNGAGSILAGGDARRAIGSSLVRLGAPDNGTDRFVAKWRYRDGNWRDVSVRLAGGVLYFEDNSNRWQLQRLSQSSEEEKTAEETGAETTAQPQSASATEGVSGRDTSPLAGHWFYDGVEQITFLVDGTSGIVTSDVNGGRDAAHFASSYPPGTEILKIERIDGNTFTGQWRYHKGQMGDVSGTVFADRIEFDAGHTTWKWWRADQAAAEKSYRAAQAPASFDGLETGMAGKTLAELRAQPPVVIDETCGEIRGPLTASQMKALFERRWLRVRDSHGREYDQIVQSPEIYETSLRFPSIATSAYTIYMCSKGTVPFVGTRSRIEQKWFQVQILDVKPTPRETLGKRRVFREVYARAQPMISLHGKPGCKIATRGIDQLGQVRWSGTCENGFPTGQGEVQWWNTKGELAWKTHIGPRFWTKFDDRMVDGRIVAEFDLADVSLELERCTDAGAVVRISLPRGTPNEVFALISLMNWFKSKGEEFAARHCAGKTFEGASFYRSGQSDAVISHFDSPDYNPIIRKLQSSYHNQSREIKQAERQAAINAQAKRRQERFEQERAAVLARGEKLIEGENGSLEDLSVALEIDRIKTLARLEDGLRLRIPPGSNMTSSQVDGKLLYRVTYRVTSPLARLERQLKQDLVQIGYKSSLEAIFDFSANPTARFIQVTCTFEELGDVPQDLTLMRTKMTSFSTSGEDSRIAMSCKG